MPLLASWAHFIECLFVGLDTLSFNSSTFYPSSRQSPASAPGISDRLREPKVLNGQLLAVASFLPTYLSMGPVGNPQTIQLFGSTSLICLPVSNPSQPDPPISSTGSPSSSWSHPHQQAFGTSYFQTYYLSRPVCSVKAT
ncbi:unnamed protein product [Protopolystoma xenopodis]|uniref:Uncharacterized protein n=1 Tax=Protopolystoma xenopodis TaxID=117903 RepID=A0A448WDF2_9PLAT|nr:unnamed protein product [Protopolystoma xenopodis]